MLILKALQFRILDTLNHGSLRLILYLILSIFLFGFTLWIYFYRRLYSFENCQDVDNIGGKVFPLGYCKQPVDIVYTWVNGSDPVWMRKLEFYKQKELGVDEYLGNKIRPKDINATTLEKLIILRESLISLSKEISNVHNGSSTPFLGNITKELIDTERLIQAANKSLHRRQRKKKNQDEIFVSRHEYEQEDGQKTSIVDVSSNSSAELTSMPSTQIQNESIDIQVHHDNETASNTTHNDAILYQRHSDQEEEEEEEEEATEQADDDDDDDEDEDEEEESHDTQAASNNRYRDNEELRYSLRSIEKYAPWIRRIFIVTDNQIPSWLDLSNPRVEVIPHTTIFQNKSHLPSFSSPSIESNIHRIPGLAERFIYFNDDVMLGDYVWPDDFYSPRTGQQKVYLSWGLPQCAEGCMAAWLGDGFCDAVCNVEECYFDYDDCISDGSTTSDQRARHEPHGHSGIHYHHGFDDDNNKYSGSYPNCAMSCRVRNMGDRFCDRSCDQANCGFDAGDCVDTSTSPSQFKYPVQWFDADQVSETLLTGSSFPRLPFATRSVIMNFTLIQEAMNATVSSVLFSNIDAVLKCVFHETTHLLTTVLRNTNDVERDHEIWSGGMSIANVTKFYNISYEVFDETYLPGCKDSGCIQFTTFSEAERLCTALGSDCGGITSSNVDESPIVFELRKSSVPVPSLTYERSYIKRMAPEPQIEMCKSYSPPVPVLIALKFDNEKWYNFSLLGGLDASQECESVDLTSRALNDPDPAFERQAALKQQFFEVYQEYSSLMDEVLDLEPPSVFDLLDNHIEMLSEDEESTSLRGRRSLLDYFGQSLLHVDHLFHFKFNETAQPDARKRRDKKITRKVPAHMPHFINRKHMEALQEAFPKEFDATSSHRFRNPRDMQFSFSYMYWVVHEGVEFAVTHKQFFDNRLDNDGDGYLSMNELRTLASERKDKRNGVGTDERMTSMLKCLQGGDNETTVKERFTFSDIMDCVETRVELESRLPRKDTFQYIEEESASLSFEMIDDQDVETKKKLDSIRARHPKFICVNDNMENPTPALVRALHNFQEALFGEPSQFELPPGRRNRFLYYDEYVQYLWWRNVVYSVCAIVVMVSFYMWFRLIYPMSDTAETSDQHDTHGHKTD